MVQKNLLKYHIFQIISYFTIIFTAVRVNGNIERIVGGFAAKGSQFPYQVSVRRNGDHVCGGVIISKNYVLTAGRCVVKNFSSDGIVSYSPDDFNIRVGSLSLYEQGLLIQVAQVKVHSNYTNMLNDLALLQLQEPLIYSDYIKHIALPYDKPSTASLINVSGWGFLKTAGEVSRYLQYLQMEVVDPSNCLSYLWGEEADQSLLCLQSTAESSGICSGDIGGLAVQSGELVGLASFTIERCGSDYPDGFTNILYYVNWIRDNSDVV